MTPSDLFTDTLTIKLLMHTTIRYLILQSHIHQIGQDFKDLLSVIK